MELGDTICFCFHVTKRKILNYLRIHKPRRASQLSECGGAGTGCGWCVNYLKKNFEAFEAGQTDADADLSMDDHAAGRSTYISEGKGTPRPGT
ncbi:(2Fe-2S)-binding protein [Thalassoglobus polymorphus]|uniref:BFD-like [2Fe-2S] binding domain protein n=1 Tax=Thalassoglobus polymorphus TaxID=2527994 RepID=A0A517QTS5_9PLAN|nr:(2Fe-2S)-binding protein [Thalassoglobus polymorphus]QDT35036.1 BFD-like [2Fe-2S] binding domain protein [Thalassoglobus polymorphus]